MPLYRKKPVTIQADQFTGTADAAGEQSFLGFPILNDERGPHLIIPTLEGTHRADPGDWIITGVKGEQYPCKPDVFALTYEPA
jgi:hypothetical protein